MSRRLRTWMWLAIIGGLLAPAARAEDVAPLSQDFAEFTARQDPPPTLPETVVEAAPIPARTNPSAASPSPGFNMPLNFEQGRGADLLGIVGSASEGQYGQGDLQYRPFSRPAELLELIPGLVATQHSGDGKANQYFLRGFNLDHGTDFALKIDGVPMNLPTNAHGQGYLDINSLIPELVESVQYKKGPYYMDIGDFGSAGGAFIQLARTLPYGIARLTPGSFGYTRGLLADSKPVGAGDFLYALETVFYDGPWVVPENMNKFNGVLKYSLGDDDEGASVEAWGYHNTWRATNQIAQRALDAGIVTRFGSLDPSDGGKTGRAALNGQYWRQDNTSRTTANAYVVHYDLDLFSNFTFYLENPFPVGDQIEQIDRRVYSGLNIEHAIDNEVGTNTVGFQFRNDDISNVQLNSTTQRVVNSVKSQNDVDQQSFSLYCGNETRWLPWMRSIVALRGDAYRFHSRDEIDPVNDGTKDAGILNPKTTLVLGPWNATELYLNWGMGFHSNDARGVLNAAAPATPLVRSNGSEIGVRSQVTERWVTTLAGWYLTLDSELVFVGDAGTTEPSGASHRGGLEFTNYYQIDDWLIADFDYAYVRPRFDGGERIPNAVEQVMTTGLTAVQPGGGWFSTVRLRQFGPAALIEDNSARSSTTTTVNLESGYQRRRWRVAVEVYNLFNVKQNDITYYYESAPLGLPPANDYHFHPVEPTMARVAFSWAY